MGERGPVGKRDEERIRRNSTSDGGLATQKFSMDEEVRPPKNVSFEDPEVQGIWNALLKSVNVKFFEPTDWAYAVFALRQMDKVLKGDRLPGAMLLKTLDDMLNKLLLTEGERRRVRIEAQRGTSVEEGATVSQMYRDAFENGPARQVG